MKLQPGNIYRADREAVVQALIDLNVPLNSEFGEFFCEYVITFFCSNVSDEELCDLLEPNAQIYDGTRFVQEVWNLPENFVCLSSIQGEGAFLYDRESGCVWDFDLSMRDDFLAGGMNPQWSGFYEFMNWYLI